jgi:tetratricopeptide (TPR) repeat protein
MKYPKLDRLYHMYLNDEDSASFVRAVSENYNLGSLERLARYGQRISRRAAVLALGFLGDYAQNEILGAALRDRDRAVRLLADHGIRQLWFRVDDHVIRHRLNHISQLNQRGRFHDACDLATEVLGDDPSIAEAFSQRATAYYANELFADAAMDCQCALELNPYHFPAAMTEAHCHMQLEDGIQALISFRRALAIYPDLENVRAQVQQLERSFGER